MKLAIESQWTVSRSRVAAVLAGASCAAAVMATAGTAAAASPGRQAAAPAATVGHRRGRWQDRVFQWDLLPGGNLSGHSNVYVINPDGTGRRQLTHVGAAKAAGAPDWSADGRKIVYESDQSGDYRIWVMNADGSGQTRLTDDPGFADLEAGLVPGRRPHPVQPVRRSSRLHRGLRSGGE